MGKIYLEDMEFYAYHGHFKEEQIVGNQFLVNMVIDTNMEAASKSDHLDDAVNYQKVYQLIDGEMKKKSHLLENIARRILDALYSNFSGIDNAWIKVSKINPPMGGKMRAVSVAMER